MEDPDHLIDDVVLGGSDVTSVGIVERTDEIDFVAELNFDDRTVNARLKPATEINSQRT